MTSFLRQFIDGRRRADAALERAPHIQVILFVVAFVVRAAWVVVSHDDLHISVPLMDALYYDEMGSRIAAGEIVQPGAFFMGPLYPYFLGLVYAIVGHDVLISRLLQAAGGALTVVLTWRLGRRVFRPTTALAGAALLTFYGAIVYFEGQRLMMWMGALINVTALLVLTGGSRHRVGAARGAVAGALFGLSALARANILLFVPVAAAWAARRGTRFGLKRFALPLVAAGMVVLPATLHNYAVSGELVPITSNGGLNFYIGNSVDSRGVFYPPPDVDFVGDTTSRIYIERMLGRDLGPAGVSAYWFRRAAADIREYPGHALRLLLRKAAMFVNGYEVPQLESFDRARHEYPLLRWLFVNFWLLSALGMAGALVSLRRQRAAQLLAMYLGVFAASIIIFFVAARYRVQLAPVLALFAANFVLVDVPRIAMASRNRLPLAAAILGLVILTQPGWFRDPPRELEFREHIHNGRRLSLLQRHRDARFQVDLAVGMFPDNAEGYIHRAIVSVAAGDNFAAMSAYARAIELLPGRAGLHYDLAQTFLRVNLKEQAVEAYREAIRIDPVMSKAYNNMGIALRELKRHDEAIAAFQRVIELDPNYIRGYNNLASSLAEVGRMNEARDVFHATLVAHPDYALTYRNLAMLYAAMGQVAPAIDAITRYIERVPGDDSAREMLMGLRIAEAAAADTTSNTMAPPDSAAAAR